MKNFTIEVTYQPLNDTWSALIKHGNSSFLEVEEDMIEAIAMATEKLFESYPPVCRICGGSGEVATDEDDGEGHIQRGVGTRKCECQLKEPSEEQ